MLSTSFENAQQAALEHLTACGDELGLDLGGATLQLALRLRLRLLLLTLRLAPRLVLQLLLAAEYLMTSGSTQVILCERGVRSGLTPARAALDVSSIPVLKSRTHLPVIVDPSHAAGRAELVEPLALAAVAAGADGLMVEVHDRPATALSDGAQSITPAAFAALAEKVTRLRSALQ